MKHIETLYQSWLEHATEDQDIINELQAISDSPEQKIDCFYRNLSFGTGGLRGVIGAGTNRMNIYTVAKASQGLANYIKNNFPKDKWLVAISYDSRKKSDLFAQTAAEVFAANKLNVYIYSQLMPTPCLSYAVRELNCTAGIMITASHNPSKYNGYKVYGPDGCQITIQAANLILSEINRVNIFEGVQKITFEHGISTRKIQYITAELERNYIEHVKKESLLTPDNLISKNVSIVYSPLNGTGLKPVLRTLQESGYTNIQIVKEQELPDGNFPTCPYPNPEVFEAMSLGIEYAKNVEADLLLATDPDCDRVGVAVKSPDGEYILFSGNETGILLLDYICARRIENGTMPENPVFIKSIVTTDMAERIAAHYGVTTINVLTGFKYIGEQISILESKGMLDSYIFGFEESYGYLSGGYVRDKDAVAGTFLISEMFAYYKTMGISLLDKLNELYSTYGYTLNTLHSYTYEGPQGVETMQKIMHSFRHGIEQVSGYKVVKCLDYELGIEGLPKSNVIKYILEENCSIVIRPSGTEPKMKVYISVCAKDKTTAGDIEKILVTDIEKYVQL
ncbi:phospho-sugar mutase [Faecalicatena sp. AGMB00832]|uniref:Phospho-sugar mutase n=1 Tax=Faecalicatena faecalis TaxID=2726362 RepID=A0ABS6DAP4_9FIRM|nr:phospho-sugar mutase [Faecalicatena faecalis]MBU3878705.1 phospho-sugar mutase [Faecalicatena faecalis]